MPFHYRNPTDILGVVVLILCLGTDLAAQSPYAPAIADDAKQQQPSIRKFTFKLARAADVLQILQQLAGPDDHLGLKIAVDERTNSLVFQPDDGRQSREFEETCALLDSDTPAPGEPDFGVSISVPTLGPTPQPQSPVFSFSIGVERGSESIETLKQRYNDLEHQAHQLADKLKQATSLSDAQRKELQLAVRKSFDARQALQRTELADLAQRMKSMQQSIDMRDKLADKVVERRLVDLLNPDLKWDAKPLTEPALAGPNEGSGDPATRLPLSLIPLDVSAPYNPGDHPATAIRKRIQGNWMVQVFSQGRNEDALAKLAAPMEIVIDGNTMRYTVGGEDMSGPLFLADCREFELSQLKDDGPLPMDFIYDPNGDPQTLSGIIACDGTTLSICMASNDGKTNKDFRPSLFVPGTKVTLIKCRRAPSNAANAYALDEVDLSKPQATLDYIHRFSIDHPNDVPTECYTEEALQELSGVMLQQLCFMSSLSQIVLQTGGVIGSKDDVPIVAGTTPSYHLRVTALIKKHSLPTPRDECTKAFALLAKLTISSALITEESLMKPDRELFRLAAGILKSPKDFLSEAGELTKSFNDSPSDTDSQMKEPKPQPKYDIAINGDEATATAIIDSSTSSVPMNFKLRRVNQRWFVSEVFSDEILDQIISSMSHVLGGMSEVKEEDDNPPKPSQPRSSVRTEGADKSSPLEWNDFLQLLPDSGAALVMFAYELETKEQMSPVAKKVAEAASVQFIELSQRKWNKIIAPPATHFVLMKDRQLVGTRTGLMTEARLQDFVAKAKDWLTPQSTAIEENSLVRIDCYISPGTGNAGSQHGGALPFTSAVIAVHEDQALLFGPDSIAGYIEKGYACVAVVRDAAGKQKQLPLDVLFKGPVKLLGRNTQAPTLQGSVRVKDGDGTLREVPLVSIYPESVTQPLEAYDVDSAIYHIRGVRGLTPTKLAAIDAVPKVDQPVLSGGFARDRHLPPIHGFSSPILWQTQTVQSVGAIYGENMNGAELFTVSCPGRPAPVGFTFNEHGRLIGRYGLGSPTDKDMTHAVFQAYATHSILHACLNKIDDPGLKAALAQTLEESNTAAFIKEENSPAAGDAANASTLQSSTSPPIKFDTPQALLARVDECSKNGSYEEFVSLFSDEGVRDLAGSLIVSAMQVTTVTELAKQNGGDLGQGPARIQEALNRWLKPTQPQSNSRL